jgi:glutamate-1-semialdehyde aminotransferase
MSRWTEVKRPAGSRVPAGILGFVRGGWADAYPLTFLRGDGAWVWDEHGRRYADWVAGKGAVTLGHAHPGVEAAVRERGSHGVLFPGVAPEYEQVAERLAALIPAAENSVLVKNGSDAVQVALRIARVFTGRDGIVSAGYHGWDDKRVVDFGYDERALERLLDDTVAAVLVTPEPGFLAPGHLQAFAQRARAAGALFIVDEVRCGLRLAAGGAHQWLGVEPDLVTLSKGLANGHPLAAVVGRADVLEASEKTYVFGTYYAEAGAQAAAVAALDEYGRGALDRIFAAGDALMRGLDAAFADAGVAAHCLGPAPLFQILFEDERTEAAFYGDAAHRGVLLFQDDGQCPSAAHDEEVVAHTLDACTRVIGALPTGGRRDLTPETVARYGARRMIRHADVENVLANRYRTP